MNMNHSMNTMENMNNMNTMQNMNSVGNMNNMNSMNYNTMNNFSNVNNINTMNMTKMNHANNSNTINNVNTMNNMSTMNNLTTINNMNNINNMSNMNNMHNMNANNMNINVLSFPATHKKNQGTFSVMDDKVMFVFQKTQVINLPWNIVVKHQVSPISHPKHLLQLVITDTTANNEKKNKNLKFEFGNREILNRIRTQITHRLKRGTKRPLPSKNNNNSPNKEEEEQGQVNSTPFHTLSPTTLAVTRASLLSSNPTLRAQHKLLVPDTLSESDFWASHKTILADEAARIHGKYRPGQSSSIKSNLDLSSVRGSSGGFGSLSGGGGSSGSGDKSSGGGGDKSGGGGGSGGGGKGTGSSARLTRKKVKLGVEEMRQIFIMYPAVHRAYEEKVPLDWSEEQFWRKYLESEYFHRDRGRMGAALNRRARKMGSSGGNLPPLDTRSTNNNMFMLSEEEKNEAKQLNDESRDKGDPNDSSNHNTADSTDNDKKKHEEEENEGSGARVSGTEDIFSRNHAELLKKEVSTITSSTNYNLAVGKFDLASTYFTERSHVGLPDQNFYPDFINGNDTSSSSVSVRNRNSIVHKYNRHWAMVLNPEEATAHTNLLKTIAAKSINHVSTNVNDVVPKQNGGNHDEMVQLVSFADCEEGEGDHVKGLGEELCQYVEMNLKNVEVYKGQMSHNDQIQQKRKSSSIAADSTNNDDGGGGDEDVLAVKLAKTMANKIKNQVEHTYSIPLDINHNSSAQYMFSKTYNNKPSQIASLDSKTIFPTPRLGERLLLAMSKHMAMSERAQNSQEHVSKITAPLAKEFKQSLVSFFRRSSELLRHFFGLRRLLEEDTRESDNQRKKLAKIVQGLETVYREMEETRNNLPMTEQGEIMKKMCLPIMDQLDYAFKLNQGSGGGFSTVWN